MADSPRDTPGRWPDRCKDAPHDSDTFPGELNLRDAIEKREIDRWDRWINYGTRVFRP